MCLIFYTLIASLALGLAIPLSDVDVEWELFQSQFDRHYEDPKERANRKMIFKQNLEEIIEHNANFETGLTSFKKGINQFSDRTEVELNSMLGLRLPSFRELRQHNTQKVDYLDAYNADIPDSIDYRKDGAVTPVKDQKECGSGWAFSAVAVIESSYFMRNKKLVSFSEQQLVDCSGRNYGCFGGWMDWAFRDLEKMGGIASSESYAYTGRDQECKYNETMAAAKIDGVWIFKESPKDLKEALAEFGPLSIALEVTEEFLDYHEGVLSDDKCKGYVNHGVLLVGYGSENGTDYWLVKNSWGTNWGEDGYIRLDRNNNNCIQPLYPRRPLVTPTF